MSRLGCAKEDQSRSDVDFIFAIKRMRSIFNERFPGSISDNRTLQHAALEKLPPRL